jgi:hypothetical protein
VTKTPIAKPTVNPTMRASNTGEIRSDRGARQELSSSGLVAPKERRILSS